MKYLAFLVLTSVPLLALTVLAVIELGKSDATGSKSVQLKKQTDLAHSASQFAETTQQVAQELTDAELFNPKKTPKVEALDPSDSLDAAVAKWNDVDEAHSVLKRYSQISDNSRQKEIKELEEFREELTKDSKQKERFSKLLEVIDSRINQGGVKIAQQKDEKEARKLLNSAKGSVSKKKYPEAIKTLEKLLALIKKKKIQKPTAAEVLELKKRYEYRRDWEKASKDVPGLRAFLAKKTPPQEDATRSKAKEMLDGLVGRAKLEDRKSKMRQALKQLTQNPPKDLGQLLDKSKKIIDDSKNLLDRKGMNTLRMRLRQNVTTWVKQYLPLKRSSDPAWMMEAVTTDGKILRGVFVEQNQNLFKLYKNKDAATKDSPGWVQVWANRLAKKPQPSFHLRSIQQYNSKVSQLTKDVFSQQKWQELERLCGPLDAEFAKYKNKNGANTQPISFLKAREMATKVLGQWTAMEKLKDK